MRPCGPGLGGAHRAAQAARSVEVGPGIGFHRLERVDLARQEVGREDAKAAPAAALAARQGHPQGLAALDPDGLPHDLRSGELQAALAARAALILEERTDRGASAVDIAQELATL